MTIVDLMARVASPWADLYSHSTPVSVAVSFLHIGGLLYGGGRAVSADCKALRSTGRNAVRLRQDLTELGEAHGAVVIGLAVTLVSGALMWAADVETFTFSRLFWLKMAVVGLLLVNGYVLHQKEKAARNGSLHPYRAFASLRWRAASSLVLWFGSALLGTALLSA